MVCARLSGEAADLLDDEDRRRDHGAAGRERYRTLFTATRMAEEIERNCVELGEEGRLIRMQLDELIAGADELRYYTLNEIVDELDVIAGG